MVPEDPDRSARRLRDGLRGRTGVDVAVIISDTFGRVWRRGLTDVAIGCARIQAVVDLRGTPDRPGRGPARTRGGVVDELAAAGVVGDGVQGEVAVGEVVLEGGAGAAELFAAVERRIDPYPLEFGSATWVSAGFRLLTR